LKFFNLEKGNLTIAEIYADMFSDVNTQKEKERKFLYYQKLTKIAIRKTFEVRFDKVLDEWNVAEHDRIYTQFLAKGYLKVDYDKYFNQREKIRKVAFTPQIISSNQ